MKRLTGILVTVIAVAVVVGLAAPPADAICPLPKTSSNVSRPLFVDATYIGFTNVLPVGCGINRVAGACGNMIGRFWQTNAAGINNEGTYNVGQWFDAYYGNAFAFFRQSLTNQGVQGCPTDCITVYIENTLTDEFILWTSAEKPVGGGPAPDNDFDFTDVLPAAFATQAAAPSPRPRVTSTSGARGGPVTLTYDVLNPSAGVVTEAGNCVGVTGAITGINVYTQASAAAPSSGIAGWTLANSHAGTGALLQSVVVDCTSALTDQWVASGLVIDGQAPHFVGNPTRIECDPALADPDFKLIPRRPGDKVKPKEQKKGR